MALPAERLEVVHLDPASSGARMRRLLDAAKASARGAFDADGSVLALRSPVRIAALIALASVALFFPIELVYSRPDILAQLAAVYAYHVGLAAVILLVSVTPFGIRHADRLGLGLVLGETLSLHAYLAVSPGHSALIADALTCMLVGSAVLFSWSTRRVLIVSAIICATFAAVGAAVIPEGVRGAPFALALGALLVGVAIAVASGRALQQLRASLARRQNELAALSSRLMSVQEEERRRLSRELHDEFGQSLTAVNAYLWLIERQSPMDATALRSRTQEARRVVAKTLSAMRELSQLLRPSVLDDFGLVPSLDEHLQAFAKRHQIVTSFAAEGLPERLPAAFETALYRITQEALTNVARHARATRVRVALSAHDRELRLEIEDDGVGFPAQDAIASGDGTGLTGIRERVRALGGTVLMRSRGGAALHISLPLPR